MPLNIDAEVTDMRQMTVTQLREKYADVFDEQTRSGNKIWLIKRIAWRLQANEEGDLSERARKYALSIANDADLRMKAPRKTKGAQPKQSRRKSLPHLNHDQRLPLPGTLLTRPYKGKDYHVTVLEEGFEFQGERYASLSAIAKVITGSHWSGYRFFGLQQRGNS